MRLTPAWCNPLKKLKRSTAHLPHRINIHPWSLTAKASQQIWKTFAFWESNIFQGASCLNFEGVHQHILLIVQKSQTTTRHLWNSVNNAIFYQPQLVISGFLVAINHPMSGTYISLHESHKIRLKVGKYTSPMDGIGIGSHLTSKTRPSATPPASVWPFAAYHPRPRGKRTGCGLGLHLACGVNCSKHITPQKKSRQNEPNIWARIEQKHLYSGKERPDDQVV